MQITYVTGNKIKFEIANNVLKGSKIKLVQMNLNTPEIQSIDVRNVAKYSALWAREKINRSVVVTDAGFYINGLNGFPGPYIKYINKWLNTEDILKLLEEKENRSICIKDCLVYCSKKGKIKKFENEIRGIITKKITCERGPMIDKLVIPESLDCTISELTYEESIDFWSRHSNFIKLKNWIERNGE